MGLVGPRHWINDGIESPPAFRRRLIFISANALSRARREFIQNGALNASTLNV